MDHDDEDMHNASFLRHHDDERRSASAAKGEKTQMSVEDKGRDPREGEDEDENDDDEPPRAVPPARPAPPNPFAAPSHGDQTSYQAQHQYQPSVAALPQAPSAPVSTPYPPIDETLRVSSKCTARHCFRLQWEAEINPRCRLKTTLNVSDKHYLFDGFYLLCHDDTPDVPQFEYTRAGVMCRIRFVREPLPQSLLPLSDPGSPCSTSPRGCEVMFLLKRYLFQQLLGIQSQHLFQTVFADPARASGDVSDYCSDFHLIPRFISISDAPLLNKEDLLAPHRIGFAVGKFLPIEHVLGCLEASATYSVATFLEQTKGPPALVDAVVSTRINGVPQVFRVDEVELEKQDNPSVNPAQAPKVPPRVVRLKHIGQGAAEYDGADLRKIKKKWLKEGGAIMQVSPRVDEHVEILNPAECHLTGMSSDLFEFGSAMPMVLKYVRHYKLLASFEADMKLKFKDKALLRQAFTHASYVDAGMQNVNTVEATISRVRLGHVFPHADGLKRKRTAFLDEQRGEAGGMDPDMKRISDQHLTTDFQAEFHSKFLCPYERLEFLGDAVLSFLVASSAFLKLPHSSGEGVLHQTRVDITNNTQLGRVARDANFDMLMLTAFDIQKLNIQVKSKIAADCLEALLGAVYKDQGIDACRALLIELMTRFDPNVRELYLLDTKELEEKAAAYVEIDLDRFRQWEKERETRLAHRQFTTKTNVAIRNTHLWLQALTHGSFKAPQIDEGEFLCADPSYERIEFLGDAVLQLLSSVFLVDTFPNHQEHLLTQARSSLVKNTRLAVVARRAGYEEFIRLGNEVKKNGNLYTEDVLADVFEATLGAVFLENVRDLDKVRAILETALFPLIKEAIQRREWMNPEKILAHHLARWNRGVHRPVDCVFRKLPSRVEGEHCIALFINQSCVARARGRTIQEAKNAACRRALHLYGVGLPAKGA